MRNLLPKTFIIGNPLRVVKECISNFFVLVKMISLLYTNEPKPRHKNSHIVPIVPKYETVEGKTMRYETSPI